MNKRKRCPYLFTKTYVSMYKLTQHEMFLLRYIGIFQPFPQIIVSVTQNRYVDVFITFTLRHFKRIQFFVNL
jgi:hypothetical protein